MPECQRLQESLKPSQVALGFILLTHAMYEAREVKVLTSEEPARGLESA